MGMFKKATKEKAKARIALFGPSGAGKTMTALRIAKGLSDKIALIDTERASASKYSDRFTFDTVDLENKSIEGYCEMIEAADKEKFEVLIIDSLSHGWQELLESIDKIAKAKYHGNTWSAWNEGTPQQKRLVNAILNYPGHLIATMRSKTEWVQEKDEKSGKNRPVRVGLAPEQGKGIEYEFDMLLEINPEHFCTVIKDRTGKFQDQIIEKPGEEFGKAIKQWLSDGAEPVTKPVQQIDNSKFVAEMEKIRLKVGDEKFNSVVKLNNVDDWTKVVDKNLQIKLYTEITA